MNPLRFVIAFTSEIEQMKRFYRDQVGIGIGSESPFFVSFDSEGGSLALLAVHPEQRREIELCFAAADVEADAAAMLGRGVQFANEIRQEAFGKVVHFRDPEGNLLSLLEPAATGGAAGIDPAFSRTIAGEGASRAGTAVAVSAEPRLTGVVINCRDMAGVKAFYRDRMGLHVKMDSPWWVELDAGRTGLALHPHVDQPEREHHHGQSLAIGFAVGDLNAWVEEARARGLHFSTAPIDEGFGLFAEASDPEGNVIVFREPSSAPAIEEQLAEPFEEDDAPQRVAIRKTVKKGTRAVSRLVARPEYKSAAPSKRTAKPRARKARSIRVSSTRGAGPAGARLKPKRAADPKRARNRPATGRLKKAERRTLGNKKRAVARASKGRPVKRAMAGRGRKR